MTLRYIFHSGFLLETEQSILIFDYWMDPERVVEPFVDPSGSKHIYVFASHFHEDHFTKEIFDWKQNTESQYNRQAMNQGRLKATLCLMALVMMLISACSSNNKTHITLGSEQIDSVTQEKTPASSKTTDAQTPSIFDELANNMVCVEVDTGNFYICKYEVTQKLWSEVMGDNPSQMQGDDLPVEQVNWNDCQRFIAKLNELTGKSYRLPTEAEWEYACRGGKHSKGFKYSGSDEIDKVAWYDGNSESKSHPVGLKKPNELGLYDMSGNVWEWCQDMHEGTGMCRGGSWIHNARNCDPSLPNETPQSFSIDCLGLRLAL